MPRLSAVKIYGHRDVDWCGGMTLECMLSTYQQRSANEPDFFEDTYGRYLEIKLSNGDKIKITEEELLEKYYGNSSGD